MLEIVSDAPFTSIGQALCFFNEQNPARARPYNFSEPEAGRKQFAEDFSGLSRADIWASVAHAIKYSLQGRSGDEIYCFTARNIGDRSRHLSVDEIAVKLGWSESRVRKALKATIKELESELKRRELLPDED